ncbi:MAG: hypothetical protein JWM11_6063 [Planctomycetaceae bacterium]|nr:hypothetical protein [Planctomycetaceae bacterium]
MKSFSIRSFIVFACVLAFSSWAASQSAQKNLGNLNLIKSDLIVPEPVDGEPGPGKRVRQSNPGYAGWNLYHVLYLPPNWKPGEKYPVLVEYPGNGGYENRLGDISTGRVEDCKLGYGISGGKGMIWVSLPFVNPQTKQHQLNWWGDADATAAYCRQTVRRICEEYGGDSNAVILTGFSRGAIACGYIGLRDDETAKLWRAMLPHSHFDGVRQWDYPASDAQSARQRLARFAGKPQFISHELSVEETRSYLQGTDLSPITFLALPYPNHSDQWVLKDLPERQQVRGWLAEVLKK